MEMTEKELADNALKHFAYFPIFSFSTWKCSTESEFEL